MAEIAVTSFCHTVEIEQVIYGPLDEATTHQLLFTACCFGDRFSPPQCNLLYFQKDDF